MPSSASSISAAPTTPSFHGSVAISLLPSHIATRSITNVPHDDTHANTPAHHGMHHARANDIKPVMVDSPTNGATSRFAGTDNNGNSGSIST